jgi:hypothetical protein
MPRDNHPADTHFLLIPIPHHRDLDPDQILEEAERFAEETFVGVDTSVITVGNSVEGLAKAILV